MYRALKPRTRILRPFLSSFFVLTLVLLVLGSVYPCSSSALAARPIASTQTIASLTPSSMTQNFTTFADPADGISIQYPSNWEKIQYPAMQMSTAAYKVVVNFLAPLVSASEQWREYLMIQVGNQSLVKNLVPQVKTTLAGNPAYKLVYTNNEETFHLKTQEAWTTIGGNTYLLIYKAEATKYPSYLPIVQRMLDSFKVGGSAGLITNTTAATTLQKSMLPNILTR